MFLQAGHLPHGLHSQSSQLQPVVCARACVCVCVCLRARAGRRCEWNHATPKGVVQGTCEDDAQIHCTVYLRCSIREPAVVMG